MNRHIKYISFIIVIILPVTIRCQVVSDPTWRLEDIFPSREAWFRTFDSCSAIVESGYKDQISAIRLQTDHLLKYAQLLSDADIRDRKAAEMANIAGQLIPFNNSTGLSPGAIIRNLNYEGIPRKDYFLPDSSVIRLDYEQMVRLRASRDQKGRNLAMKAFWEHQRVYEDTLASLLEAITRQHYLQAKHQGYSGCLKAVLLTDSVPEEVYHTLIRTVKENLAPMHRYIRLKQQMLGLHTFCYADLYASAVPEVSRDLPLEEGIRILSNALGVLGPEYEHALDTALTGRWIDFYPREGKYPSNWSTGVYGVHPYILMNYSGTYESLTILAHELGHAIHSWFASHNQPFEYSEPGSFLNEVPSMLNETLLLQWILDREGDDLIKLYLLDGYLERIRNGIYRQTLFAEFDLLKHERIESGQPFSAQWLDSTYLMLVRDYYGHDKGMMVVDDYIRCEWSMVPDPDLNFSVYQYPVGITASLYLSEQLNGPYGPNSYINLLKAGGSAPPLTLLKRAGVDFFTPLPFLEAIRWFDEMVGEMEELVEKLLQR